MQYVDGSALIKKYVDEPDSPIAKELLAADEEWVTAAHTEVEVRRTITRLLRGRARREARESFAVDWDAFRVVELDRSTCTSAAELAEETGVRTLDALHLAALQRVGAPAVRLVTFDVRQGAAARSLGWTTVGA